MFWNRDYPPILLIRFLLQTVPLLHFSFPLALSLTRCLLPWRSLGRAAEFLWAIRLPVAVETGGKAAPLII